MKKKTIEQFIVQASEIHNNKYTYDKAMYRASNIKTTITCPIHGDFSQIPQDHLNGRGCRKCAGNFAFNEETFKMKANEIHNNRYNYDKIKYKAYETKITITCPMHGDFLQRPSLHLKKSGCPKCGHISISCKLGSNTEAFKEKAGKVHNNKYCYDKSHYILAKNKITITCPVHGDFLQIPHDHLNGSGCPKCVGLGTLNTKEFIEKSNKVHNNKYNYDKVICNGSKTKIIIICHKHGEFKQTPHSHLCGSGCPICKESKGEKLIREYLKQNNISYEPQYRFKKSTIPRSPFDFFTIQGVIEYHGKQHYSPFTFGSKKYNESEMFYEVIQRDFKKEQFCKQHNIPLLIIPYWDKDRIPEILNDWINGIEPTFSEPPEIVVKHEEMRQEILNRIKHQETPST